SVRDGYRAVAIANLLHDITQHVDFLRGELFHRRRLKPHKFASRAGRRWIAPLFDLAGRLQRSKYTVYVFRDRAELALLLCFLARDSSPMKAVKKHVGIPEFRVEFGGA